MSEPTGDESTFREQFNTRIYVACTRCRRNKIKCSGSQPCWNCEHARSPTECTYPIRNRKVAVPESYLRNLQAELKSLKSQKVPAETSGQNAPVTIETSQPFGVSGTDGGDNISSREQRISQEERYPSALFVGEAACATFGNRLLQFLRGDEGIQQSQPEKYFTDRSLLRQSNIDFELPNRTYGKLLVRTYLRFMGADFHFILRKQFLDKLDETYRLDVALLDPLWLCRLFAMFALGELYSTRMNKTTAIPGTSFFLTAISFLQDLYEEPTIEYVEALVLLSFYSQALNRGNASYTYVGIALRISLALGLHRKIPDDSPLSAVDREHHIRVWWTVYCLDRLYSSKRGHPMMIRDEDIDVQLPSMLGLSVVEQEEFYDSDYILAHIKLSKITGSIINDLYQITQQGQPNPNKFEHSVQRILGDLRNWQTHLPTQVKVDFRASPTYSSRTCASLHLHFGQCIILTTRPIFFHIFRLRCQRTRPSDTNTLRTSSPVTFALADSCVQAARSSNIVLTQLWVDGCLATYGFFDALSLFSSTLILMMATILHDMVEITDSEAIETSWNLLKSMAEEGNAPASGYFDLLMELQKILVTVQGRIHSIVAEEPAVSLQSDNLSMSAIRVSRESVNGAAKEGMLDGLLDNPLLEEFLDSTWQMDLDPDFHSGVGDSWNFDWEGSQPFDR